MTEPTEKHRAEAERILKINNLPIRFTHTIVSERNKKLADDIALALSARDTEIREVLEGLRAQTKPNICWCADVFPNMSALGNHAKWCLAARDLWEKVQPVKEGKDG